MRENYPSTADKQYLKLLELAATTSEEKVESVLRKLIEKGTLISFASAVAECCLPESRDSSVEGLFRPSQIELSAYDSLPGSDLVQEAQTQWSM